MAVIHITDELPVIRMTRKEHDKAWLEYTKSLMLGHPPVKFEEWLAGKYADASSATPSQADEKGRPMTYWGGRPDNGDATT